MIFGFCGSFSYQIKRHIERQGHHLFTSRNIWTVCRYILMWSGIYIATHMNSESSDNLFIKIPIQYSQTPTYTHTRTQARAHAHAHPDIKRFERKSTYPTKQIQWQKNEASWQLSESKRAWKIWSNVYWFIVHVGFSWVRCFETHITFVE